MKGGHRALYTCQAGSADGFYAQCDGGLCFTSTEGAPSFLGFDLPLAEDQIICSCPIDKADPSHDFIGYQIVGPFPCEERFFENCMSETANAKTGSDIFVGAPTGVGQILTLMLDGRPLPDLNECVKLVPN